MNRFLAWLNGARPEFIDSLFPSRGAGRDVTRVQSFGTVKLQVDVALQGMEALGFDITHVVRSRAPRARRLWPDAPRISHFLGMALAMLLVWCVCASCVRSFLA